MERWRWLWRGTVTRVIDGDTIEVMADRGYNQYQLMRLRLSNINAPELRPRKAERDEADLVDEKVRAILSRNHLTLLAPPTSHVVWETDKKSFDRYVSWVWISTTDGSWPDDRLESLNHLMVASGHAVLSTG